MKHLLEISQLNQQEVKNLINLALEFKNQSKNEDYSKFSLANIFYEASTRTRVSFEKAAKNLKMSVINLDIARSSEQKGEVLLDTIKTLEAMGINILVIRHAQEGIVKFLAKNTSKTHIINGGDGKHAHPTQALLDIMTIVERKPNLNNLKIAIVGDIKHSRVANSLQCIFKLMDIGELRLITPNEWKPSASLFGNLTHSLEEGLKDVDVIITLRIQKERFLPTESLNIDEYCKRYTITPKLINYAKSDVIILHPGPVNRGIEINDTIIEAKQSLILEQVKNGVFMRMAVLKNLLDTTI